MVAILASEVGKAVSGETKVDLLVTPAITLLVGVAAAVLVAIPVASAASWVGDMIMWGTELHPFVMGIVVSTLAGMALTLPISSAAICAGLGLTGLAGGAALAGCCAQMVGFAVMSFPENRWGGLVSQGIGTILKTIGTEAGIDFLMSAGSLAQSMARPAMAAAIGYALQSPPMVLFTLVPVGF